MPLVTEEQIEEAKQKAKQVDDSGIKTKKYGTKQVWIGANGDEYDNLGEAHDSLERQSEAAALKKLGLNDQGQTLEQVAQAKKISELLKKKEEILKQAAEIDKDILKVKLGEDKLKKKK